jgi:hypothetical protein
MLKWRVNKIKGCLLEGTQMYTLFVKEDLTTDLYKFIRRQGGYIVDEREATVFLDVIKSIDFVNNFREVDNFWLDEN